MSQAIKRRLGAVRIVLEESLNTPNHLHVSKIQASCTAALISAATDVDPECRSEIAALVMKVPFVDADKTALLALLADGIAGPIMKRRRGRCSDVHRRPISSHLRHLFSVAHPQFGKLILKRASVSVLPVSIELIACLSPSQVFRHTWP
jgi:hypothetical protein